MFQGLIKSLKETARYPQDVEIICAVDNDDLEVLPKIVDLVELCRPLNLKFFITEKGEHFINTYWNPIAKIAQGRWIMAINDDSEFLTKDWDITLDRKMSERAKEIGTDIICGLTKDFINRTGEDPLYPHFSCWCLQSKEFVRAMGYFYDPRCAVWGPDNIAAIVYKRLGMAHLVSLTEIEIHHNSFHLGRRLKGDDENYERFLDIDNRNPHNIKDPEIDAVVRTVKRYLMKGEINKCEF